MRIVFDFWGVPFGDGVLLPGGRGLTDLLVGRKYSGRSLTKLEGDCPTTLRSRYRRPTHHRPSPAFKHSIRSPSNKPRSVFPCRTVSGAKLTGTKRCAADLAPDAVD